MPQRHQDTKVHQDFCILKSIVQMFLLKEVWSELKFGVVKVSPQPLKGSIKSRNFS